MWRAVTRIPENADAARAQGKVKRSEAQCKAYYNGCVNRHATRRLVQVWIAIWALLFSSLAPAASHLFTQPASRLHVEEICTSSGTKIVAFEASAPDVPAVDPAHDHAGHCMNCCMHLAPCVLPPAPASALLLDGGPSFVFPPSRRDPATFVPWTLARSRAPPYLV
jgi:hypothetical protein